MILQKQIELVAWKETIMDLKNKLKEYIDNNLEETFVGFKKARFSVDRNCLINLSKLEDIKDNEEVYYNDTAFEMMCEKASSKDVDSFIDNNKDDNKFQKLLFEYIDRKGLKDSDVYNKVHIDRRLFSKIRSDSDYHPSKETVILLGFALELKEDELLKLLESAAYSLPKNNIYDLIIRFCFIEGVYSIEEVNNLLDEYNCKLLMY